MNYNKLYQKYINIICRKYYIFGFLYLLLNIICVYYNIKINNYLYIFELEVFNIIEISLYLILNFIIIFFIQLFINKICLKYDYLSLISLIFTLQLFILYCKMFLDIIIFGIGQVNFVYYYNLILTYV